MELKDIKDLAKLDWLIQGFNGCANYISLGPWSAFKSMYKNLGYGHTRSILYCRKDYLEYFYLVDDFKNTGNNFLNQFKEDPNYFRAILNKDNECCSQALDVYSKIQKRLYEQKQNPISREESIELHKKAFESHYGQLGVSHVIEGLTYVLEKEIVDRICKELNIKDKKKATKVMNDLTQPIRPSFITEENVDLLNLTQQIMENPELLNCFKSKTPEQITEQLPTHIKEQLENHAKKYFFYQLNYYHVKSLEVIDYVTTIKENILENAHPNIQIETEKTRYEKNIKQMEERKKELKISQELETLLNLSIEILHWQDDRKKQILQGVYYMHETLSLVAKTWEIDLELLKRLDPIEVTVENLRNLDLNKLKERLDHYIIYYYRENNQGRHRLFTEEEFRIFMQSYKEKTNIVDELHGLTASTGKAVGRVKICKTKEDIVDFKQGEILVTSMTRPEYVPAMKKAAAIITDEGGITCHAAIISRELGVPCIIGTKIATKVLETGMQVEVRANHGLVKIIKK